MGREDHDPGCARQLPRRRQAIHTRHANVHQHDIRFLAPDEVDRLAAVGGFTRHLHIGLRLDDHPEARANQRLVVSEGDTYHVMSLA